ncbi:MAG TPA: HD domain-containing protein [Planctomycetes bacterium]|nr:HD domain-containing protein [Planctomycetota bacterium]HIN80960.1 HD domain-containing protein [Planctomycetota bacterium]
MEQPLLRDISRGDRMGGIYLVEGANLKTARNGKHFIQMALRDHTSSVKAVRWETSREEFRKVESKPFLRVEGRVEEYQGNPQVIVDKLEALSAKDANLEATDFLPRTKHDVDAMQKELEERIAAISDEGVRSLVLRILERPGLRENLRTAPAGKMMHHAYIGGLLEHVLSLVQLADKICDHYPRLDRDIFLAGVVLHDIGKTEELSCEDGFSYTDEGQMVGHIVMVVSWIDEAARDLGGLDPEMVLQLKHLVVSHHGKLEYGSPKKPMTAEALAMHFIDNLDAKLIGYFEAYDQLSPTAESSRWGEMSYLLDVRPYFPTGLDFRTQPARTGRPKTPPESGDASTTKESGQLPF